MGDDRSKHIESAKGVELQHTCPCGFGYGPQTETALHPRQRQYDTPVRQARIKNDGQVNCVAIEKFPRLVTVGFTLHWPFQCNEFIAHLLLKLLH